METVTFLEGTLVHPILLLCILYSPTIIYLIKKSYDKLRKKYFLGSFPDNIVMFIFPLATNISFYGIIPRRKGVSEKSQETKDSNTHLRCLKRTRSLEVFDKITEKTEIGKKRSYSCHVLFSDIEKRLPNYKSNFVPRFSMYQSNVLYFFFFSGALFILFLETYFQTRRRTTPVIHWLLEEKKIVTAILVVNLLLWLDFIRDYNENSTKSRKNIITKELCWTPIYPFIWFYNLWRYKVFVFFPNMFLMLLQQAQFF